MVLTRARIISATAIGLVLLLLVSYCSGLWPLSAEAIDSMVVDGSTNKPIEGAVVVAYWQVMQGSVAGDSLPCVPASLEEAVTDREGRFHIPGWGPTWPTCRTEMPANDPIMFVFKPGYYYGMFDNLPEYGRTVIRTPGSFHDQLALMKIPDDDLTDSNRKNLRSAIWDFNQLSVDLGEFTTLMPSECNWKKMPKMMRALEAQRIALSAIPGYFRGLTGDLIAEDEEFRKVAPQCGSTKEFIEGLMK